MRRHWPPAPAHGRYERKFWKHYVVHKGEKHGRAKLTDKQADQIRESKLAGIVLAAEYGVSPAQVSKIRNRKSRAA